MVTNGARPMDPNASLRRVFALMADQDLEEAFYLLSELISWVRSGGLIPDALPQDHATAGATLKVLRAALKDFASA